MKLSLWTAIVLSLSGYTFGQRSSSHPLVYVDGNGAEEEAAKQTATIKRDDQTMEFARDLLKACPEITVTRNEEAPELDYVLLFNRGEEYGLFKNAVSQVMLLDPAKNILSSSKQGTVARAAKDGCKAVLADWKLHHAPSKAAKQPNAEGSVTSERWYNTSKPTAQTPQKQ